MNGYDLAAEKLGLATSPPYLSLISKFNKKNVSFLGGVNFASGGAGIFNRNDVSVPILIHQCQYLLTTTIFFLFSISYMRIIFSSSQHD
jgi:predicted transcriptional regulator